MQNSKLQFKVQNFNSSSNESALSSSFDFLTEALHFEFCTLN